MKNFYRPEIDGLRAIAIVSVILYHSQTSIFGQSFKGGFIGVDIFFVISGYLISLIILKEMIATGSFVFKHFYEKRIRRILPALLCVMLVSLPFAWIYLLPSSFVDLSKSILYSLGFSSNFYFHFSGQEYADQSGLLKPFLHTWSLSVEEQYYILFPIVLITAYKYFKKYLVYILILGFIVSLGLADYGSKNYPSASFYFFHTRIWELFAGTILAYLEITIGHRSKIKILNLILPSIGVLLIGYSILFFDNNMFHPSFYSLLPIIGVCLLIWFSSKNEIITKVLSSKPFVGIGLISYSLYLWHYPIFAFLRIVDLTQSDMFNKLLTGIIILIISIISYYFIEKPFRNRKNKFKVILGIILITVIILIISNLNIIFKKGYENRLPEILTRNSFKDPWNLLENSDGEICHDNLKKCKFNTSSNKKVYIIGDSHMASLTYDLKDKVIKNQYQFVTTTFGGCLYYPGFDFVIKKSQKINKKCNDDYFQKLKQTLLKETDSIIIFGGRFPLYLTEHFFDNQEGGVEGGAWNKTYIPTGKYDTIQNSFKNEVLELSNTNKIILIYPIPEIGWNVRKKIYLQWINRNTSSNFDLKYITTSYKVYQNRTKSSFKLLDSIQGNNIHRVYPHLLFCDTTIKDRCITHDNKDIYYVDDDHPFLKGTEMINNLIIEKIEKIEFKSN
jgi:peptidoglycan/LPS O-acetylase OafA/YrhL